MYSSALFFAVAVLGVNGAPFDELKVRQNDIANTTSSETDKPWSVFSPQTAKSRDSLDVPGSPTSITVYSSPVTAITQLSLQGPNMPEETGTTTTSITVAPSPIVQPSDTSLLAPVTTTTTDGPSAITSAATAHIENSGTIIVPPGPDTTSSSYAPTEPDTTSPSYAPKMPHTEVGRSDLDQPSKPTDQASTEGQDGNSGSEATAEPQTQAGTIIPGATGSAQPGNGHANQQGGGSGDDAGAHASPTFVIGNTPLIAGGSPVTMDGTTYSLASTGAAVVVNGNTIAFTTNTLGQAVPAETTSDGSDNGPSDDSISNALGGLSTASASATSDDESAQETGSTGGQQSTRGATSTTSATRSNAGASTTTGSSAPAVQSDSAAASNWQTWPITAMMGAIGVLAMVM